MRERKFKAKDKHTNKWVFGSLVVDHNRCWIYSQDAHFNLGTFEQIEVYPETVCEFIGRKDIEDKDIYEHDFVEHEVEIDGVWSMYEACEIVFNDKYSMFCFKDDAPNLLMYYRKLKVVKNKFD